MTLLRFLTHPIWHTDVRRILQLVEHPTPPRPPSTDQNNASLILAALNQLREPEGNSVTIFSDKADFDPTQDYNCMITCCGDFTEYKEHGFTGDTLLECFVKALGAQSEFEARFAATYLTSPVNPKTPETNI